MTNANSTYNKAHVSLKDEYAKGSHDVYRKTIPEMMKLMKLHSTGPVRVTPSVEATSFAQKGGKGKNKNMATGTNAEGKQRTYDKDEWKYKE